LIHKGNIHIFLGIIVILVILTGATALGSENPVVVKNIEFVNADLRDVFRSLAEVGKFNVIMEPRVHGDVTLTLKYGVTLQDAISVIAKTYGYSCRWLPDSPTAVIGTAKFIQINFDRKVSKVYQLKFADPIVVAASLEVVIPKTRIKADPKTNQIVVVANDMEIANISEIIARLDRELLPIDFEVTVEEVNDQIWKYIGIENVFQSPHMGVYLLTEQQIKKLNELSKNNLMTEPKFTSLDNHQLKIFIGDKVPLITAKKRKGDTNYKVEYINAGTSLGIVPRINSNRQLTMMVKAAVSTVANKSQPGANWVPWVVTRDFESTIRLEVGQALLFSGLLQRSEYNMMKNSPYQFPVLSELFKSTEQSANLLTEVIVLITPRLSGKTNDNANANNQAGLSKSNVSVIQNPVASSDSESAQPDAQAKPGDKNVSDQAQTQVVEEKLPINEDKPDVKINLGGEKTSEIGLETPIVVTNGDKENRVQVHHFIEVQYHVKKGDTLTAIVKKFGTGLQLVMAKNNIAGTEIVKADTVLIIPVPSERIYILKPKETLWRIAKRYGTTMDVLKDLNGITDETKMKAGQKLVLPVEITLIANLQF
jgi:LysM repeat protein